MVTLREQFMPIAHAVLMQSLMGVSPKTALHRYLKNKLTAPQVA
ncbi:MULTISPECIES: hypothetical protein [unclassified Moorena]|nr:MULTISPECIES: hypothetical protein [unclassified Moorena]